MNRDLERSSIQWKIRATHWLTTSNLQESTQFVELLNAGCMGLPMSFHPRSESEKGRRSFDSAVAVLTT